MVLHEWMVLFNTFQGNLFVQCERQLLRWGWNKLLPLHLYTSVWVCVCVSLVGDTVRLGSNGFNAFLAIIFYLEYHFKFVNFPHVTTPSPHCASTYLIRTTRFTHTAGLRLVQLVAHSLRLPWRVPRPNVLEAEMCWSNFITKWYHTVSSSFTLFQNVSNCIEMLQLYIPTALTL